jgi:hypothetical protein
LKGSTRGKNYGRLENAEGRHKRLDVLNQKIDGVDAKLDQHRQETKDSFAGVHRLIGGISANTVLSTIR